MSDSPSETNVIPETDPSKGLMEFYSSQAKVMLSLYQNIERLLGSTNDWTSPGTYCEILLRDFLCRHLPAQFRASKGFIYGRRQEGEKDKHCPEIDILVYDAHEYSPVLQIEDFVIVQAKATKAVIQVKRQMDPKQLRNGLENLKKAKQHVFFHDKFRDVLFPSALVFFDENRSNVGKPSKSYEREIRKQFSDKDSWKFAPEFIGSLQHHFFYRCSHNINHLEYACYPSIVDGSSIAIQFFLWAITYLVSGGRSIPPMPLGPLMNNKRLGTLRITNGPTSQSPASEESK